MGMNQLKFMKAMAAERGEWKEVERLNKAIAFNLGAMQLTRRASRVRGRARARTVNTSNRARALRKKK